MSRDQESWQIATEESVINHVLGTDKMSEDILRNCIKNPGHLAMAVDRAKTELTSNIGETEMARLQSLGEVAERFAVRDERIEGYSRNSSSMTTHGSSIVRPTKRYGHLPTEP
jgi:hypothetical protein